jgi:hypothetical protein
MTKQNNGTKQTPTEDVNAQIERELQAQIEAELASEMAKKRLEIAARLRREAEMREYDRINARHPIQDRLAGLTPEQDAERQRIMREGARRDAEWMARVNARPVEGSLAARRADQKGGAAGFEIKRGPR